MSWSRGWMLAWVVGVLALSCGSGSVEAVDESDSSREEGLAAYWVSFGLADRKVNALEVLGSTLYAGTDSGVYARPLSGGAWQCLGLSGLQVVDLSVRPGLRPQLVAALSNEPKGRQVAWSFGPSFNVWTLTGSALLGRGRSVQAKLDDPDVVLATSDGALYRSVDQGATFAEVARLGILNDTAASTAAPSTFWVGGENNIFAPVLYQSVDGGKTWSSFRLEAGGDNAVDAILTSATDARLVVLGMEGRIMRTADGGRSWSTVLSGSSSYLFGLARDPANAGHLVAAGGAQGGAVQTYESTDEGLSFVALPELKLAVAGRVDALVALVGGVSRIFLATPQGVFTH